MDKYVKQGFKLVHKPKRNGTYIYQCPKKHDINYFCETSPLKYECPVCLGLSNIIAYQLNKLNN